MFGIGEIIGNRSGAFVQFGKPADARAKPQNVGLRSIFDNFRKAIGRRLRRESLQNFAGHAVELRERSILKADPHQPLGILKNAQHRQRFQRRRIARVLHIARHAAGRRIEGRHALLRADPEQAVPIFI